MHKKSFNTSANLYWDQFGGSEILPEQLSSGIPDEGVLFLQIEQGLDFEIIRGLPEEFFFLSTRHFCMLAALDIGKPMTLSCLPSSGSSFFQCFRGTGNQPIRLLMTNDMSIFFPRNKI